MPPYGKDLFSSPKSECSYYSSSQYGITTHFHIQHPKNCNSFQKMKRRNIIPSVPRTVMGNGQRLSVDRMTTNIFNLNHQESYILITRTKGTKSVVLEFVVVFRFIVRFFSFLIILRLNSNLTRNFIFVLDCIHVQPIGGECPTIIVYTELQCLKWRLYFNSYNSV